MKISIMGYSGAGKTTLANQLAAQYGCGVLHLDRVNFTHGWRERDRAEAQQMLEETLAQPDWVIDGNYANLCIDRRLAQSDRIILLLFPRRICFFRAVKRYLRYRGRTRPDMGKDARKSLIRSLPNGYYGRGAHGSIGSGCWTVHRNILKKRL